MTTQPQQPIAEDEIDLRELFATIWRYKGFIFWLTTIITLIAVAVIYRMPKYYKTTTTIEVKPKSNDSGSGGGLASALGGAGALLGLAGIATPTSSTEKDAALLSMYRVNSRVLDSVTYNARYWHYDKFRYNELGENNCSIYISDLKIHDYKKFGMEITFESLSEDQFKLGIPSTFLNKNLGIFSYNTRIHTEFFDMIVHKNKKGTIPSKITLYGDKRYIFNNIIMQNLEAKVDAKSKNPFIEISYLDTIPSRGERYTRQLIGTYVQMSISDELNDIDVSLAAINKQIREIQQLARKSKQHYQSFKTKNTILSPEAQAKVLIEEKAGIDIKISEMQHKLSLVKKLVSVSKNKRKVDTMAPALAQLEDEITAGFVGQIQELQSQKTTLAQEFKPSYPKLQAINHQISNLRIKVRSSLIALQKILSGELALLKKEKQKFVAQLKSGPKLETGLASLMRDYKLYETMYTYLLQKRSSEELKKAEALSRFRTIDPIYTNPVPAKPKKALIAIVTFVTALLLSILLAFFRELLRGGK